jgi:S-adenosylmethionine:tRNA ribosyltransferase-isomerase
MIQPRNISINDYDYDLPSHRIAQYPLAQRDESKLLIYNGSIEQNTFKNLASFLPAHSMLVFNNTRVVRARLMFKKKTGASIEIFCLEPMEPTREIQDAYQQKSGVVWKCLVGNRKKWKGEILEMPFSFNGDERVLKAERVSDTDEYSLVKLCWQPEQLDFATVLEETGKIPLPPYMNRDAEESDLQRYQTIYAHHDGSVAAPTAGLHFTRVVLDSLAQKQISTHYLTLHVGAGTFKPVSQELVGQHTMHREQILVKQSLLQSIINKNNQPLIAVGTTSVRTLESLYWLGVKMLKNPTESHYNLHQWEAYELSQSNTVLPTLNEALGAILAHMNQSHSDDFRSETQILIGPGYEFKVIDGMITNFHQPKSTLLLLISAYLGSAWKSIYDYALQNHFRFLSYGDSCLFFTPKGL